MLDLPPAGRLTLLVYVRLLQDARNARPPPATSHQELSTSDLTVMLSVPEDLAVEDWRRAISLGRLANSSSQSRTGEAMRDPAFQTWFGSAQSRVLAINGMERRVGGFSAMSHLVALMRDTLEGDQSVIPLTYFCGDHTGPGDSVVGVSGAMRTICLQLIMFLPEGQGLRYENVSLINGIHSHGIESLCELFRRLLAALAASTSGKVVFCLIDDVSWLEDYASDLLFVMTQLRAITNELLHAGQPVLLKTLFTSAMYCEYFEQVLDHQDIVTLRSEVYNAGARPGIRSMDFTMVDDPYDVF